MSNFIINITDGINYSRPVVNRFSSDFDRVRFVMDLSKDMSSYSFGLAASVSGECFMLTEDNEKLIRSTEETTGKILIDWIVGTEVTALDGVVTYQIVAYTSDSDGNIQSIWYSPQGKLTVGESLSLTEYENAEIGTKPSLLMQILSKLNKDELDISALQNAVNSHIVSETIDHPDGSVTRSKLSEDIVRILDDSVTEQKLDSALTPLIMTQDNHTVRIETTEKTVGENSEHILNLSETINEQSEFINDVHTKTTETDIRVDELQTNISNLNMSVENIRNDILDNAKKIDICEIINTISGETLHIEDSAKAPFKNMRIFGKTNQTKTVGKNMIPFPYYDGTTKTINGITFIQNNDGSVTYKGSATAKATYILAQDYSNNVKYPISPGTYTISSGTTDSSSPDMVECCLKYNDKTEYIQSRYASVRTKTIDSSVTNARIVVLQIIVNEGTTSTGTTIYPMLEKNSVVTTYEPYSGGIPSPSSEKHQKLNNPAYGGNINIQVCDKDYENTDTISVSTPNGLPGVPIYESLSFTEPTYIDSDNQMWICDEINFDKGIYIKRTDEYTVDMSEVVIDNSVYVGICKNLPFVPSDAAGGLWECGKNIANSHVNDVFSVAVTDESGNPIDPVIFIACLNEEITQNITSEDFKSRYNGTKMLLALKNPVEIPLPEEVIETYKNLTTHKPITNISNSANAYTSLDYVCDPKNYIDKKLSLIESAIISLGGNI